MPKGTIKVVSISENESVMYVYVPHDTDSDAILVRRDAGAIVIALAELAAKIGFVRLFDGREYAITGVQYATA